jgi:sugar lactone lactonase YvrE
MAFIDTDSNTAGVQHVDVSGVGITPREVVFSPDGATLYVGYSLLDATSTISTVTMSDFTLGTLATTGTLGNGVNNMRFDSTGRLWVARGRASSGTAGAISIYDLSAPSVTHRHVVPAPVAANVRYADALALSRDGTRAYVPSFGNHNGTNTTVTPRVAIFDLSDLTQVDSDGSAGNGTTNITLDRPPGGHTALVTD